MSLPLPNETSRSYDVGPFYYANDFKIINNVAAPTTTVDVSAGNILDSTATFQLETTASLSAVITQSGLGGLDTGSVAASKVYGIYLISDPVSALPSGIMFSLSLTQPLMPFGYGAFALLGYCATDSSSHILKGYWTVSNTGTRLFFYDAPQATAIVTGNATSYTAVNLITLIPNVPQMPVWIASSFVPGAASRVLNLQPGNATGNAIAVTGQVTSVPVTSNSLLLQQQTVISTVTSPTINYKVSNSGDAVAINVAGYQYEI